MNGLGLQTVEATTSPVVRELSAHEAGFAQPGSKSALKRISERHHALARSLAAGLTNTECSIVTGYAPGTITLLKRDPAFIELIHGYRQLKADVVRDLGQRLVGVATDALDVIRDRLEEKPEDFSNGQLMELTKLGADRTGFGPTETQTVNVNTNLAVRLEAARKRVTQTVVDVVATEVPNDNAA